MSKIHALKFLILQTLSKNKSKLKNSLHSEIANSLKVIKNENAIKEIKNEIQSVIFFDTANTKLVPFFSIVSKEILSKEWKAKK